MTTTRTTTTSKASLPCVIATVDSPVGTLHLVAARDDPAHLRGVLWADLNTEFRRVRLDASAVEQGEAGVFDAARRQLSAYFDGSSTDFDLPLAPTGTEFQLDVWASLRRIPFGVTSSYGRQAASINRPTAVRAVAAANGRNPISIVVPCHRVIGSDGRLTGFAGGLDAKSWLLAHERRR